MMETALSIATRYLSSVKSRTVLAIVAMVVINGVGSIQAELLDVLGETGLEMLNGALGLLAIYFRINTRTRL